MTTDSIQHVVPVEDGIPPLDIQSETEVFREQGGAGFTVTKILRSYAQLENACSFTSLRFETVKRVLFALQSRFCLMEHPLFFLHATGG